MALLLLPPSWHLSLQTNPSSTGEGLLPREAIYLEQLTLQESSQLSRATLGRGEREGLPAARETGICQLLRLKQSWGWELEKEEEVGGIPKICNPALPSIARLSL